MPKTPSNEINFSETIDQLDSGEVWVYETGARRECRDVSQATFAALQAPIDFPPLGAAIVAGDRVALAVDPNVPCLMEVIGGVAEALSHTGAAGIDVVLWDEATDRTVDAIGEEFGDSIGVTRHQSTDRGHLRYVAADESADPIYLSQRLVDADFVLPVVSARPLDTLADLDLTGVFPLLADSASRLRDRQSRLSDQTVKKGSSDENARQACWLLGIQIMVSVTAGDGGEVAQVTAGALDAVRKQLTPARRLPDGFPPAAHLVVASLDGDAQQQSWSNAARAVAAASRYVLPGGTIVLWSAIDDPPSESLLNLADRQHQTEEPVEPVDDDFPHWDLAAGPAQTLAGVAAEHRLLIHSRLPAETIESMGLGSVRSTEELARLSRGFETCGVLRAAQFAGTTSDAPNAACGSPSDSRSDRQASS